MMTPKRRLFAVLGIVFLSIAVAGCETGFVTSAARSSLASFITDVLSTAVNETVNPAED